MGKARVNVEKARIILFSALVEIFYAPRLDVRTHVRHENLAIITIYIIDIVLFIFL